MPKYNGLPNCNITCNIVATDLTGYLRGVLPGQSGVGPPDPQHLQTGPLGGQHGAPTHSTHLGGNLQGLQGLLGQDNTGT